MDVISIPVLLLAFAMILAIIIERLLEIAKSIYDYIDMRINLSQRWTHRAERIRDRLEVRFDNAKRGDRQQFDLVMIIASRYLVASNAEQGGLMAVSADKVRAVITKVRFKFAAVLLGIGCAWLFNIDIITLVEISMLPPEEKIHAVYVSHWFGIITAGIAMGVGAAPMHKLITVLEKTRNTRRELLQKIQGN
ncbi:MAG: hypothetical protein GXP08_15765 [Gammaproteobacteria bacterium]|nr:hypothetical protein [Gammaproteobacteria bacterium]